MRTCMYCGRELKDGEVCSCPGSVARRNAKNNAQSAEASAAGENTKTEESNSKQNRTSYKTGYAGKESGFERARNKYRAKQAARRNSVNKNGFFPDLWDYIKRFLKAPVDTISNPKQLGKGAILTIAAVQGALLWLCMFFVARGGAVGPFRLLASAMSFGGAEGYRLLASVLLCAVSGAIGGIVVFFLYSGIFYLINRFVMRLKTPYWDFCVRLVSAWILFTVICLIGTVLSILSSVTLIVLLMCGAVSLAVLTYEGLRTEWISLPPSKVLYGMLLGYFIFFTIMGHLIFLGR